MLSLAALPLHINPQTRILIEAVRNLKVTGFPSCNAAKYLAFEFVKVEVKELKEKEKIRVRQQKRIGHVSAPRVNIQHAQDKEVERQKKMGGASTRKSELSY